MFVFDAEIRRAIPKRGEPPAPGIEFCQGWRDFAGMGIACICAMDLDSKLSMVFLEKQFPDFEALIKEHGGETAGFNTRRFDIPLLAAHGITVPQEKHYDALEQIWLAQGLNPDQFSPKTHGGWSLDAIMLATFALQKSKDSGAMAPIHWQTGNRGRTVNGCLHDCFLEALLVTHMRRGRPVKAMGKPTITISPPNPGVPS